MQSRVILYHGLTRTFLAVSLTTWRQLFSVHPSLLSQNGNVFLGFCWVLYGPVHESVIMAPWSERPGILTEALVREGFVVKTRSRWLPCRLGSS